MLLLLNRAVERICDISNSKINIVIEIFVNVAFEQYLTPNNNDSANVDALKPSMSTNNQKQIYTFSIKNYQYTLEIQR